MLSTEWTWTDPRDGTKWRITGVPVTEDRCLGPLVFRARDGTRYAVSCGVVAWKDAELQRLLDRARRSQRVSGQAGPSGSVR